MLSQLEEACGTAQLAQLAQRSGAKTGPLRVALRTWGALGVLKLEPSNSEFEGVDSQVLNVRNGGWDDSEIMNG